MIENLDALSNWINSGVGLIPTDNSKKPFEKFTGSQKFSLIELVDKLRDFNSNCVAIRVGEISGGLVCIDVDSKHKEGFSQRIFTDVKDFNPEIFDKLIIDKTPSGGLHFYYLLKKEGEWIKNSELSSRFCTEDELLVRPDLKKKCFLELKASNNSLSHCYPSLGYTRVRGDVLSVLTEDEHSELISLCKSYNEIIEKVNVRVNKSETRNYEEGESPIDQFNVSQEGCKLLDDFGWRRSRTQPSDFIRYIKPGSSKNNIGATFSVSDRFYNILTSDSDIDQGTYTPFSILCKKKHNGDWRKLFVELINQGYGKLKPEFERSEIRRRVKLGLDLPKNISEEGKKIFEKETENRKKNHPFGVFWEETDDDEWEISREDVYLVSRSLGFRIYKNKIVKINDIWIEIVDDRYYFNCLKSYIGEDVSIELKNVYEGFLQNSGKFTISRLDVLDEELILKSKKNISYKFYKNCYVKISGSEKEILNYEDLDGKLVWKKDVKDRDFYFVDEKNCGLYFDYIQNAIGWSKYVAKCIGYYAHDHHDEESYLIITSEKCEHTKDGGGSGKNIFWSLLKLITTFKSKSASMIKRDNQLLQSWDYERVFVMSDLPKNFDLIFFKDMIDQGASVRKLYQDEFDVDVSEMAKFGASTNYSFDNSDPGLKRRVRVIEFNDFYTKRGGVKKVHDGKMFPKDWIEEDYVIFDNIMMDCIQVYLQGDNIIDEIELSGGGFIKQFEQKYNHLYDFIRINIDEFSEVGKVSNQFFMMRYDEFLRENNIKKGLSAFTINKALEDYCSNYGRNIKLDSVWRDASSKLIRGRVFGIEVKELVKADLPF